MVHINVFHRSSNGDRNQDLIEGPNRSSQGNREDADEEDGQGSCSYKRTLITESKAANRLRKLMQILFPMVQKVQLTLMEMCTNQFHKKLLLPMTM